MAALVELPGGCGAACEMPVGVLELLDGGSYAFIDASSGENLRRAAQVPLMA